MSKKLCITKIEIEIKAGRKIELSLAEAKELHEQLHELFGDTHFQSYPVYIERPRWYVKEYPFQPWITYTTAGTSLTTTAYANGATTATYANGSISGETALSPS